LNGAPHICQEVSAVGFDRPGGFAQYSVLPAENAVPVPGGISYDVAACLEPFGNAVYTARCVDLVNKVVWVTGCGPQGLMAIAVAKAAGARIVIATEMKKERQDLAWTMLRAHANPREKNLDQVIDPNDPELLNQIYDLTQGLGVDVILEMSGAPKAISDGFLALRRGGHVVALGLSSTPRIDLDWNNCLVMKEAVVRGIYGRMLFQTWTEVHHMLVTGKVNLEPLLYPRRFSLEEFQEGFDLLLAGRAAKVIFYPNGIPSARN
jgi:threonine 3-dehydrogenase